MPGEYQNGSPWTVPTCQLKANRRRFLRPQTVGGRDARNRCPSPASATVAQRRL